MRFFYALILTLSSTAWAAPVAGAPVTTVEVAGQTLLADRNEMTVYTFDPDGLGVSNCYDRCAQEWPPVLAAADETVALPYSLVTRKDGTSQIAINGHPLYLFADDHKSGDIAGNGLGHVWHIVVIAP